MQAIVEHGGTWPTGEWGHGARGIVRCFSGILDTTDPAAVEADDHQLARSVIPVDMRSFEEEVEGGFWRESHGYIRRMAATIRKTADNAGSARVHYFGLAEIPHVIALGAYCGDERKVAVHDYDRARDSWAWPGNVQTLEVEVLRAPREPVAQSGPAVIRMAISNAISDVDVDAIVPRER